MKVLFLITILILMITYIVYCIIPTYYYKFFKPDVVKSLGNTKNLLLTFDDGVDGIYTEKLLDVLKEHNTKAVFFIVAQSVEDHPHIIKRIVDEGHTLGLHSLEHKNALLKGYFYTQKDFYTSMQIMEKHGLEIKYYRPPWGHINIFTLMYTKYYNLEIILWNVMAQDWKSSLTATDIANRILKRISNGSIICLHDGRGEADAPKRTIAALKTVIPFLNKKGYKFIKIGDINGRY